MSPKRVAWALEQSGLTQIKVAKKMGITQSAVAQLKAKGIKTLSTLEKFAKAVGIPLIVIYSEREFPRIDNFRCPKCGGPLKILPG